MNNYISYAGIGSRSTPPDILVFMEKIAKRLSKLGFILRSGGADGADSAFEKTAILKEIYLPWENFRGNKSIYTEPKYQAYSIAKEIHPAWNRLNSTAQKLMARNSHQILGIDLKTPCHFVVCWTPDGCETKETRAIKTGGTGQAIELANINNIPVFNLKNDDAMDRLADCVKRIKGVV